MRAVDPALLIGLALAGGAALPLAPGWAAAAAVGVWAAASRGTSRVVVALALAAFVVGGARAASAIDRAKERYQAGLALVKPPARCVGDATVRSSPVVLLRPDAEEVLGDARIDVELLAGATCDDKPAAGLRARVYGAPRELARGDRVALVADVAPLHLFLNDELPSPWPSITRTMVTASGSAVGLDVIGRGRGPLAWIDHARAEVRERIQATFPADAAPLARALVLGEADLAPDDDQAFRDSGLAHLLAVSGTHLVVAVLGAAAILRAILLRIPAIAARGDPERFVSIVLVPITWAYADFAGGSGSAIRAAAMLTVVLATRALGRRPLPARSLGLSLLGCAIADPLVVCDVSFSLSAAATAGLFALGPPIAARIVRGPAALRVLLAPVAATLAATIPCTPLLAMLSPTVPVLGVAANVVAAPVGELAALPLCLLHALLAPLPSVERGAALLGSGALVATRFVARVTTASGAVLHVPPPTPGELAALVVGAAFVATASSSRRRAASIVGLAGALAALEIGARAAGCPTGELRVTALDVGQGDALLVDLPDGRAMMIDGGGFVGSPVDTGVRVLLPVLRMRRRSRVDVVVLTHPHPDHFGGLASALPALAVGELWDTGQGERDGAGATYAHMLAALRARGVPIRRPADVCGAHAIGGARVDVLAPCPALTPDVGANDNSFVLRVAFGARAALLVGDTERGEEGRLLAAGATLSADLLKVGHHGSRTSSSPAFLAAVAPSVAVVSTGVRNRFGHPNPIALSALAATHATVVRTDLGGAVAWSTDGERVSISRP